MFHCSDILDVTVLCLKKICKIYILDLRTISGENNNKNIEKYIYQFLLYIHLHFAC